MVDFLDEDCAAHLERVREGLDVSGITHVLESRLVRGLDYYTRTTFEFAATALDAAQNAIGGGGRYDGLTGAIGGPPTPGVGFGIGIERLLLACDAERCFAVSPRAPDVFVVDVTGGAAARDLSVRLRDAGLAALRSYDNRSLKAQLKLADRSGARYAVIVGPREVEDETVTVRLLEEGKQTTVRREELVEWMRREVLD